LDERPNLRSGVLRRTGLRRPRAWWRGCGSHPRRSRLNGAQRQPMGQQPGLPSQEPKAIAVRVAPDLSAAKPQPAVQQPRLPSQEPNSIAVRMVDARFIDIPWGAIAPDLQSGIINRLLGGLVGPRPAWITIGVTSTLTRSVRDAVLELANEPDNWRQVYFIGKVSQSNDQEITDPVSNSNRHRIALAVGDVVAGSAWQGRLLVAKTKNSGDAQVKWYLRDRSGAEFAAGTLAVKLAP